jgi:hypothetical protein
LRKQSTSVYQRGTNESSRTPHILIQDSSLNTVISRQFPRMPHLYGRNVVSSSTCHHLLRCSAWLASAGGWNPTRATYKRPMHKDSSRSQTTNLRSNPFFSLGSSEMNLGVWQKRPNGFPLRFDSKQNGQGSRRKENLRLAKGRSATSRSMITQTVGHTHLQRKEADVDNRRQEGTH